MSDDGDQELIALIAREQRSYRFVMYFGVAVLIAMALMSAALGIYYKSAQDEIALAVQRQSFQARRDRQAQNNEITNQRIHIRRISDELRRMSGERARSGDAIAAAHDYLERGQLGLSSEQLIASASRATSRRSERALLQGVAALIEFDRSGETVQPTDAALPPRLQEARAAFSQAVSDPVLRPLAQVGLAYVLNQEAQRLAYTGSACPDLFAAVAASAVSGRLAPRPLYWRANCERKLGQTGDALRDYAAMLAQSAAAARSDDADHVALELAMNAFHGVGTTLIALHDEPADNADKRAGLAVAQRECQTSQSESASTEMALAIACLDQAMSLRRRMGQNPAQVAGSGENLGFAYLRDNDFAGALAHATRIERDSLSPWNELVRAISAARIANAGGQDAAAAREAARQARTNISFFTTAQFNLCEVRRLLNADLFDEAVSIVRREHPQDEMPACVRETAAS